MLVRDVMTAEVVQLSPDNSVRQAAKLMFDHKVSGLPVLDDVGKLLGIITEGDLIRRTELCNEASVLTAEVGSDAEQRATAFVRRCSWRVGDVMTPDPVTVGEDTSLSRVAAHMHDRGIKRIPVVRNGELVGIVSRADLLEAIFSAKRDETPVGDEAIRRSIRVRLAHNAALEGLDVSFTVTAGIVHLWGKVEAEPYRKAARVVAEGVNGVRGVVEHFPETRPQ